MNIPVNYVLNTWYMYIISHHVSVTRYGSGCVVLLHCGYLHVHVSIRVAFQSAGTIQCGELPGWYKQT